MPAALMGPNAVARRFITKIAQLHMTQETMPIAVPLKTDTVEDDADMK
jgi:hypothetical protein